MGVGGGGWGLVVEGDPASLAFGCSVMSKGQNWTFGVYGFLTFIPMWKKMQHLAIIASEKYLTYDIFLIFSLLSIHGMKYI